MKAIRIHAYGKAEQLALEDVPRPSAGPNQVLVRIRDAGVNPVDVKIRAGLLRERMPLRFPVTVGQDFAGEIVEPGQGVTGFAQGDRVFGFAPGSYAEFAAIPIDQLAKLPDTIDFMTGAALPTAGLTAYQMMMDVVDIGPGKRVLIHGAAGGVGSFVTQLAVWKKAHVLATASAQDLTYVCELGADDVIDYKRERFEERFRDLDIVVDLIGGDTQRKSFKLLRKGGTLITTVGLADRELSRTLGVRAVEFVMQKNAEQLGRLASLVDQGILQPRLGHLLPFEQARHAQELNEAGGARGKIVLKVA